MQKKIFVIWLTGLPASGKTTVGSALKKKLHQMGYKTHHLDGDEIRKSLTKELGFTKNDRDKNIKTAVKLARKYQNKKYHVIASFVSPYQAHRELGKKKLQNFIEVFINAPLAVCEQRDPKGLYKKARDGKIKLFTGVSDIYQPPLSPDIELRTDELSKNDCTNILITYLKQNNFIE